MMRGPVHIKLKVNVLQSVCWHRILRQTSDQLSLCQPYRRYWLNLPFEDLTFIQPQSFSVTQHRFILILLVTLSHQSVQEMLHCDQQTHTLRYVGACLLKHYCNCNDACVFVGHTVTMASCWRNGKCKIRYKNLERKTLKCNSNIYFDKQYVNRVTIWIKINLSCVRLNRCDLFRNRHRGMASVKIGIISKYYCIHRYRNLKRKIMKCNSNIYCKTSVLVECIQLN